MKIKSIKISLIALIFSNVIFSQPFFQDDFEDYIAGQRLACQNPNNWTTWNIAPCDSIEDPCISTDKSYSGTYSVLILRDNDLIKQLGNYTAGKWYIIFYSYFPTGKGGYFSILSGFTPDPYEWGMECYFYDNGTAELNAGGVNLFNYSHNSWLRLQLIVDLDIDNAEFWIDNNLIHSWQWTLGAYGTGSALKLAANNFFGADGNENMMYIDNYWFSDLPNLVEIDLNNYSSFALQQNYPNPFNPSTIIKYQIPKLSYVTLKVYDVLGNEVATLVNEEKPPGEYEVEWNASGYQSGVYFYHLQTEGYIETKKMIILK